MSAALNSVRRDWERRYGHDTAPTPPRGRGNKWKALELIMLVIAVVVGAILLTVHFEQELTKINWRLVVLICGLIAVVFAVYRWQMHEDSYDVLDMVMTGGKADLDKHLTILSFGLSVWLVVQQALSHQPVTELMLGILGFFVLKRGMQGFSDAFRSRPPAPDQSINVLEGAQVSPSSNKVPAGVV